MCIKRTKKKKKKENVKNPPKKAARNTLKIWWGKNAAKVPYVECIVVNRLTKALRTGIKKKKATKT